MSGKNIITGCVFAVGLSTVGYAQPLIDVSLGDGSVTPSGAAVLGTAGDQWNSFDASFGSFGPISVFDSTGAGTSAAVSILCDGGVMALNGPSQPLPDLTHYYAFNNTGGWIAGEVEGLQANQAYNLVLYVASDDASGGDRSVAGAVFGATLTPFFATGDPQSSFVNGENVVELQVVTNAKGALTFIEGDGIGNTSGEVDLNGFQLQAVPEPASLAALGIGFVALWARRKKKA
jgi:hypothetical protein